MYACIHIPNLTGESAADLIAVAKSFSPFVEMTSADTVVLSIDALRRYIGPPHQIASEIARVAATHNLIGNIGIAANIDTAILAARNLAGVTVIPKGAESKYIGEFRIETLPIDPETYTVLDRWGVRTLEDFSVLPEDGIRERLGSAASYLQQLARGGADRPLRPAPLGVSYEERFELEHELTLLEPLLFILARLVNELCDRLTQHSMATTELRLKLELANRSEHERILNLPIPTRDSKMMLKLLQLDLEAHSPGAPVIAVTIAMRPVDPRIIQADLYTPPAPEPEKLELTLAKIRAMVGEQNAGTPTLLNTHRPGAWKMCAAHLSAGEVASEGRRIAFRYFTPPLKARVELQQAIPKRIYAQHIYGNVIEVAGPWRTSGDWWTNDPWNRDEWDIGLNDGVLYRLYQTHPAQTWYLEGAYD